jgi:sensor histidine kinase YesM
VHNSRKKERKQFEQRKRINDLEVKALRSQMNPHFLFNSFSAIQHYILKQDKKKASIYLAKFASLMRMILKYSQDTEILLSDELQFLKAYLEMESLRFENSLTYSLNYVDLDLNMCIPSMIIQPLIENAIKHGLLHKDGPGYINIDFQWLNSGLMKCCIEDNGIGRTAAEKLANKDNFNNGKGIQATVERLQLLHPGVKENVFTFVDLYDENDRACGSRIEILLPVKKIKQNEVYYH